MDGLIVIDKPATWTSHDVVNRVRRLLDTRKVGHLGTLDPMATGVLPIVVGRATRLAKFFMRSDKVYDAIVTFGHSTDSYDADGSPTSEPVEIVLDREAVEQVLARFIGEIEQQPPAISAKKINGKPAYKLARRSVPVELKPVMVEIYSIEILECATNVLRLRVHCGPGTYMRTLAHDLGRIFGSGAHLSGLRRLASGGFEVAMAHTLDQLAELRATGRLQDAMIPSANLLPEFPSERVDASTAGFIRQGRDFRVSPFRPGSGSKYVKAVSEEGELIAIGEARLPNVYHPVLVL